MAKTIPVVYHNGVLVPQVELEGFEEGQHFDIQVPDAEELDLLAGDGDEPWVGFISTEDALEVVERTAGSWGPIPPGLLEEIAMDDC
jgi:predicted DNA-binding antitoxin AbrB/MazE fold protein